MEYLPIAVLFVIALGFSLIGLGLSFIIGPRQQSAVKSSPYESGMVPIGPAMRRFPVKFYLVAVLFILFDIEIIFLFPWAVYFRQLAVFGLIEMGVFIAILLVGYIYVWKKGALDWE